MEAEDHMTKDREKDKDQDKDRDEKDKFADDPPIIVGGGGSTWVWIPRFANMETFLDPRNIPANIRPHQSTMPPEGRLRDYMAVYLPSFTIRQINVHDGRQDHGDRETRDDREHRTKFKSA